MTGVLVPPDIRKRADHIVARMLEQPTSALGEAFLLAEAKGWLQEEGYSDREVVDSLALIRRVFHEKYAPEDS